MKQQREHWGTKLGFVMAAAGSAIGLGSLARFPYLVGENGGGLFVLLYLAFSLIIGLPIFIAELVIGRKTQKSAVSAYSALSQKSNAWKMVGWLNMITCFLIISYYSVIAGWGLNYVFMSMTNFTAGKTADEIKGLFDLLIESADINVFWFLAFIALNIGVVYAGVRKGIEHWSRILMPTLFVILIALFAYCTTLSGFRPALSFLFNFAPIKAEGVLQALGMSFYTLSLGMGIILTYGSYLKVDRDQRGSYNAEEDLPKMGLIVTLMTTFVSVLASLIIFPIIFTEGLAPQGGMGLIFQTLPVLFQKLPGSVLISTTFFVLFVFTALTSSVSLLEVVVANLMELLSWSRKKAVLTTTIAAGFFGIPSAVAGSDFLFKNWKTLYGGKDFLATLDYITGSLMLPIAALLSIIFVGWFMEKRITTNEFLLGTKFGKFMRVWLFLVRYICPIAIILVLLQEGGVLDIGAILHYFC